MKETNQSSGTKWLTVLPVLFGFFVMGFVDVVGIATNYVKQDFELSDTLANLLPMMVFLWFALFSIPTGIWMSQLGRKQTVLLSLGITAVGMLLPLFFYDFVMILFAFALLGIGNTILQVSLNPMVARTVHPDKITSVLTLGQFIKAISSFLGPVLAGVAAAWFGDWKLIFLVYAVTSVLSLLWLLTAVHEKKETETEKATFATTLKLLQDRKMLLFFFGILFLVGIDVGLNTTIPKLLMERAGLPLSEAGLGTSLYFAARTAGTFAGAILLAKLAARPFFRISMLIAIIGFVLLMFSQGLWLIGAMIVVVGLALSNIFSIIFALALEHRPSQSNEVSALLIMGVSGGALIPPLMGVLNDQWGMMAALFLLLFCMFYIGFIALNSK